MSSTSSKKGLLTTIIFALFGGVLLPLASYHGIINSVSGQSMGKTIPAGIVLSFPFHSEHLHRGKIVSFAVRNDEYIKRIIGLPGDRVTLYGGSVYIQPQESSSIFRLAEPYLPKGITTPPKGGTLRYSSSYKVPQGSLFVLADNRATGADSRNFVQDHRLPSPFVPIDTLTASPRIAFGWGKVHWLPSYERVRLERVTKAREVLCVQHSLCPGKGEPFMLLGRFSALLLTSDAT